MSEIGMVPHSRPWTPSGEEWAAICGRLQPGRVADGPLAAEFAEKAAGWLGGTTGVVVNSGSNALHLALAAVGAGPGKEVIIPDYCCAALLNAVHQSGAAPVLVDSQTGGFNLCPQAAARAVTPRTAAIVVAHLFGHPAPLEPFLALGPPVVEDCAQSIGAMEAGVLSGTRGAVSISSFYATKVLTTGQGGVASTSNHVYRDALLDLVQYDNREDWQPRFSYRMSELQAMLGLWQLDRLGDWLARRRMLADYYDGRLTSTGFRIPVGAERAGASEGAIFFRYVLQAPDADAAMAQFHELGIDAKRPVHRPLHHYLKADCPAAQKAHDEMISLPLYPALTDQEVERVADALLRVGEKLKKPAWQRL